MNWSDKRLKTFCFLVKIDSSLDSMDCREKGTMSAAKRDMYKDEVEKEINKVLHDEDDYLYKGVSDVGV